jgi:hypothetical protein
MKVALAHLPAETVPEIPPAYIYGWYIFINNLYECIFGLSNPYDGTKIELSSPLRKLIDAKTRAAFCRSEPLVGSSIRQQLKKKEKSHSENHQKRENKDPGIFLHCASPLSFSDYRFLFADIVNYFTYCRFLRHCHKFHKNLDR